MSVTLNCNYCGEEYEAKRKSSLFCSTVCRVNAGRDKTKEFEALPVEKQFDQVEQRVGFAIDRTRAFTDEEQEKVNKLPRAMRYLAMARPDSGSTMSQAEIEKHYQSSNYPALKYHSSGGGGAGSSLPNYR
jgi:hypothetical protein